MKNPTARANIASEAFQYKVWEAVAVAVATALLVAGPIVGINGGGTLVALLITAIGAHEVAPLTEAVRLVRATHNGITSGRQESFITIAALALTDIIFEVNEIAALWAAIASPVFPIGGRCMALCCGKALDRRPRAPRESIGILVLGRRLH